MADAQDGDREEPVVDPVEDDGSTPAGDSGRAGGLIG